MEFNRNASRLSFATPYSKYRNLQLDLWFQKDILKLELFGFLSKKKSGVPVPRVRSYKQYLR